MGGHTAAQEVQWGEWPFKLQHPFKKIVHLFNSTLKFLKIVTDMDGKILRKYCALLETQNKCTKIKRWGHRLVGFTSSICLLILSAVTIWPPQWAWWPSHSGTPGSLNQASLDTHFSLAALVSLLCGLLSSCREQGLLFVAAQASYFGGFSCRRVQDLGLAGFNSCGTQAQQLRFPSSRARGSTVVVHRLRCSCGV